mmetsp:Transcript_108798/g.294979  ORF Transcript_108798/g.294979 Transcript_108798/m.294979 type:complete len:104 (-) Transcript_108798:189-500(-)
MVDVRVVVVVVVVLVSGSGRDNHAHNKLKVMSAQQHQGIQQQPHHLGAVVGTTSKCPAPAPTNLYCVTGSQRPRPPPTYTSAPFSASHGCTPPQHAAPACPWP